MEMETGSSATEMGSEILADLWVKHALDLQVTCDGAPVDAGILTAISVVVQTRYRKIDLKFLHGLHRSWPAVDEHGTTNWNGAAA
ncbi:unnamed protein product [Urochloa humidicola]